MKIKSVAIYVRVSTQEQASEGYSIGEQVDRLHKYCEAHDWKLTKDYLDPGFSGGSMERPGLKSLIDDVERGIIDKVLVYKLDRLSRSQKDTLYLIEDVFLENKVDFVSMTENFDTGTPLGRAMIGILSVFAQLEREQIKERMSVGREGRAKSGLWGGGANVPIGYRYDNNDHLTIEPYEADLVRRIFKEYNAGRTITSIWSDLKKENKQTSYGEFTRTTVRQILLRPTSAGYISYNGQTFKGEHDPIVSLEEWEKAKKRLDESAATDTTHFYFQNRVSPITGICYCGKCGQKMISRYWTKHSTGETIKNIVCPGKSKSGCKSKPYRRSDIEDLVIESIKKLRVDCDYLREIRSKKEEALDTDRIAILEEHIQENKRRISKFMDLYSFGSLEIGEVKSRIDELSAENDSLTQEIQQIHSKINPETMSDDQIVEYAETLGDYLEEGNVEQIRFIVTTLIRRIDLDGDNVVITWTF